MKASKYFKPYFKTAKGKEKCSLNNEFTKKAGAYLIRDADSKEPLYVGMSKTNIYRTLYRHFQSWTDGQHRVTFKKFNDVEVRIIETTATEAARVERFLIRKTKPSKNVIEHVEETAGDEKEIVFSNVKEFSANDILVEELLNMNKNYIPTPKKKFKRK